MAKKNLLSLRLGLTIVDDVELNNNKYDYEKCDGDPNQKKLFLSC